MGDTTAVTTTAGTTSLTWDAEGKLASTSATEGGGSARYRRPIDPFGNARDTRPAAWAGDHGFVGGIQDPATGLTNLGAREYQPSSGRFISPDPLLDTATPQQWNGYAYSNNNPVNESDPTGLRSECGQNGGLPLQPGRGPGRGRLRHSRPLRRHQHLRHPSMHPLLPGHAEAGPHHEVRLHGDLPERRHP
ncbi:RHS repeat-associated core domain-containing protein [Streptomyces sp. NPDC048361]|uniref:RHS repeat-associated core domain-containing protein n=1 Tax=Streptomyces sp. NPDC048361 TaxID=3154720 RepID=UPI00343D18B2